MKRLLLILPLIVGCSHEPAKCPPVNPSIVQIPLTGAIGQTGYVIRNETGYPVKIEPALTREQKRQKCVDGFKELSVSTLTDKDPYCEGVALALSWLYLQEHPNFGKVGRK